MSDLPTSWASVRLSDLGRWIGGGTPSKANLALWNGPIPWVSPKDMKAKIISNTVDGITAEAIELSSAKRVPPSSVLVVTRSGILAHSLPVAVTKVESALNQDLKALSPSPGICPDYVAWGLRACEQRILDACRKGGTTVHSIEMPRFHAFELPIAPTNEQHCIVDRIEALFDEIDRGVESLRDAKRAIGLYRQSLLKSAFEGRLTAQWREENPEKLESPSALLARIREEREERHRIALEDWERSVAEWRDSEQNGKGPTKPARPVGFDLFWPSESLPWPSILVRALLDGPLINGRSTKDKEGGFPVLRLTALKNGYIDLQESKEGDWSEDDARPFFVKRDDIFISRGNGSKKLVGMGGGVLEEPTPVAFPDTMIRLRLDISAIRPQYFLLAWNSWTVRQQIEKAARTTAGI